MKLPDRMTVSQIVGLPIAVSAIAVALGMLKPLFGLLAATGLVFQAALGYLFGRVLWSWVREGRRGLLLWSVWSVCLGIGCAIAVAAIWGIAGGILFGVFLSTLLFSIGYLESKQRQSSA